MSVTTKRGQATAHSARAEGAGPQVTSLSSHTCATPNDKVRHLYLNQAPGMLDAAATTPLCCGWLVLIYYEKNVLLVGWWLLTGAGLV